MPKCQEKLSFLFRCVYIATMSTHTTPETRLRHRRDDDTIVLNLRRSGIDFSHEDAWDTAKEHVQVHRFFLGRDAGRPVSLGEGLSSWKLNVFEPISDAMNRHHVGLFFPRTTRDNLHLRISDHWFFLKTVNPLATADQAVVDFLRRFGSPAARLIAFFLYRNKDIGSHRRIASAETIDRRIREFRSGLYADIRNWPGVQ